MPVRIIVCGGRHFSDRQAVFRVLDHIHTYRGIAEVIQGECPTGADKWAREWAVGYGIPLERFRAEWEKHGRRAGPIRNRKMLELKPDGVVAFPGGRGTADMRNAAREAGVPVYCPFG
ncbi:MAG: DUF2493 domain-containing protein [Halopseudomonas sp.]|uniref:DUF2493 domain-containing protein n=1 Tax=Halopseudomonas sp. TaxID=2901191 RepID=UPI003002B96E